MKKPGDMEPRDGSSRADAACVSRPQMWTNSSSPKMNIVILRLGHRPERDKRVTTHVALTGRAFGARGMFLTNDDEHVKRSISDVSARWGGDFFIETVENWRRMIKDWKEKGGKICHLTMYGINILDIIDEIREEASTSPLMVIVGAEKVPRDVFEIADWNVAVGHQPHSEVAALAVFLDRLYDGKELRARFADARIEVIPCERAKKVIRKK